MGREQVARKRIKSAVPCQGCVDEDAFERRRASGRAKEEGREHQGNKENTENTHCDCDLEWLWSVWPLPANQKTLHPWACCNMLHALSPASTIQGWSRVKTPWQDQMMSTHKVPSCIQLVLCSFIVCHSNESGSRARWCGSMFEREGGAAEVWITILHVHVHFVDQVCSAFC